MIEVGLKFLSIPNPSIEYTAQINLRKKGKIKAHLEAGEGGDS